jgi:hypothetical protein
VPKAPSHRTLVGGPRFAVIALLTIGLGTRVSGEDVSTGPDCGVSALYILLRLEGKPSTVEQIESTLPRRNPAGYSMAELASASRALGVDLEGVRLEKGGGPITRPAIAYLEDGAWGHFAVVRPVGTTGTMVQVIDPPSHPLIADYDRVLKAKSWTGRVLVPRRHWSARRSLLLAIATSCSALLAVVLYRRVTGSRTHSNARATQSERRSSGI